MIFKRIEINGFKSFADPVTIELTEGITCIVGPNGSGKSNISDAIRWVLGEQSPKMLRGGKMEEVIFSGTQSRRPKGMAEVSIVLDNSDGTFPIDFSEVVISRRMYRSGDSEYRINQTPCRLRDVRELIMDTGMGVEGYSIIGQGKIADIVGNKMESRREIFEEAAGIVKYRTKKEESERKLERAAANLDRVNDIIGEIKGRIGGLEEDSKKAEEYIILRDRYQQIEVNIALKSIDQASEKIDAVREELAELSAGIEEKNSTREELHRRLKENKEIAELAEQEADELRAASASCMQRIHEVSSKKELDNERRKALAKEIERLESERESIELRLQKEQQAVSDVHVSSEQLLEEKTQLAEALKAKEDAAGLSAQNVSKLDGALSEYKEKLFERTGSKAAFQSEIESVHKLRATLSRRLELLDSEQTTLETDHRAYAGALEKAEDAYKREQMKCANVEEDVARLKKDLDAQSESAVELSEKLAKRRASAEQKNIRKRLLEELEGSYEGYSGSVRFLMKQKQQGITGVVGELLQVPKGFEVAIETALGASVGHIVCDDDVAAKKAIQLLKERQAGRLTFLPLSSLRPAGSSVPQGLADASGFLGIASDIVQVQQGMERVLDYLLARVVLCEDLDSATSMSKIYGGTFRFVTLQGDVISPSGAITGGSLRNKTGEILSRKAEIQELSDTIEHEKKQIESEEQAHDSLQNIIASLKKDLQDAQADLQAAEKGCAVLESEIQQLSSFADQAAQTDQRRGRERDDLVAEMVRLDENVVKLQQDIETINKEIIEIEQNSQALIGEIEQAKENAQRALQEATEARIALNDVESRIRGAHTLLARVEDSLQQLQEEAQRKNLERVRVDEELALLSIPEADESEILGALEREQKALSEKLEEVQARRKELSIELDEMELKRTSHEQELYALQQKQREAEVRQAKFETQAETLKQRLWDEFEMSLAQAKDAEAEEFVMSRALRESREIKQRMRELGDVNVGAIEEYKQVSKRYEFLTEQQGDLSQAIRELTDIIEDTDATIRRQFKQSFDAVVENFEEVFTELFGGGHARLSLTDPSSPLDSAIDIEAQPPGKKLQNINLLSGGEKAMTAIALMFAVLKAKPTPFCILDEVEAALDDANIDRFARYLRKFYKTQFALITHQKATMEYADVLYGITMPEQGISKVLSLRLGDSFEI